MADTEEIRKVWRGRAFFGRKRWQLAESNAGFIVIEGDVVSRYSGEDVRRLSVRSRWFRHALSTDDRPDARLLRGLRLDDASEIEARLHRYLLVLETRPLLDAVRAWCARVEDVCAQAEREGRWINHETRSELEKSRPIEAADWLHTHLSLVAPSFEGPDFRSLERCRSDSGEWFAAVNERITQSELTLRRNFLDRIESTPLTEEQARAVICFDNRVQVIAAAGSGKTSVMVARTAYAIDRGFVPASRILLLAFNRAAADELQVRVDQRLSAAGITSAGVRANTFHAFGLEVIGRATGRKPRLAPWLDGGQDVATISRIVDELRDSSPGFRYQWDMFRLIYSKVGDELESAPVPDAWDPAERVSGLRTYRGEVVRSHGERMIADWLFLNGVPYEYEKPYVHDVATAEHSQYRPDFYYPGIDVWHEHWALDAAGNPPSSFKGYKAGMAWKRQTHLKFSTALIETTWADIIDLSGFAALAADLEAHGAELDWNPDREIPGSKPVKHEDLARLMRTFMTHVKSNSLTRETLAAASSGRPLGPRTRLFLDLYWQVHAAWEERLRREDVIDFEDMLVLAADHIESGRYVPEFELVLVDEFQDASRARARLTRALVAAPGRYLLAVGDDWQSINRFAGADLSVMTDFEGWFGHTETLRLQTTFRCPPTVSRVATDFVKANPRQLRKRVHSARKKPTGRVAVTYVSDRALIPRAMDDYLGNVTATNDGDVNRRMTADVLGRYRFDRDLMPQGQQPDLTVTFRTVHGSKGLEADYVLLPNVTSGTYGFPSSITDDPVLSVVMAEADPYPFAEERRLFYVALTRARVEVMMFAVPGTESPFLVELVKNGAIDIVGDADPPLACPSCGTGMLVRRTSRYGTFLGCSAFPRCRHTEKLVAEPGAQPSPF